MAKKLHKIPVIEDCEGEFSNPETHKFLDGTSDDNGNFRILMKMTDGSMRHIDRHHKETINDLCNTFFDPNDFIGLTFAQAKCAVALQSSNQ